MTMIPDCVVTKPTFIVMKVGIMTIEPRLRASIPGGRSPQDAGSSRTRSRIMMMKVAREAMKVAFGLEQGPGARP